jgi:hypothetical protein
MVGIAQNENFLLISLHAREFDPDSTLATLDVEHGKSLGDIANKNAIYINLRRMHINALRAGDVNFQISHCVFGNRGASINAATQHGGGEQEYDERFYHGDVKRCQRTKPGHRQLVA